MKSSWWRRLFQSFRMYIRRFSPKDRPHDNDHLPQLDRGMLKQLITGILSTRPDELTCGECYEQVDQFAEMVLAGKNAAEAMPLVQDHLDRCHDCREEFEALLEAIREIAG